MVVEVNNLRLMDDYEGFSHFYEEIERCKMSLLVRLSSTFAGAKFVFYNLLGAFCDLAEAEKLLSNLFKEFEIRDRKDLDFNSSPVNNVPVVRVDGALRTVEGSETVGCIIVEDERDTPVCNYTTCVYLYKHPLDREMSRNEFGVTFSSKTNNFYESKLLQELKTGEERLLLLKVIRGEDVCF